MTIWARVPALSAAKVEAVAPVAPPALTAQSTAGEDASVKAAASASGLPACFYINSTAIIRVQGALGEKVLPLAMPCSAAHWAAFA